MSKTKSYFKLYKSIEDSSSSFSINSDLFASKILYHKSSLS